MRMKILILVIFLVGCVNTAKNMDYVFVGMSREGVIIALGEPTDTRTSDGVEYMYYRLRTAPIAEVQGGCGAAGVATLGLAYLYKGCRYSDDDYFIQLKEGKVAAYGRMQDAKSTQDPGAAANVNQTIKEEE